jgi:hypothetical protein
MSIQITAEQEIRVGEATVVESVAPEGRYVVVFEDDEETGYFYALDTAADGNPIQDALHIYNVESVSDRDEPSVVAIGWSADSLKAMLLINDYPHAVFDFESKNGYCRTGFPPPMEEGDWACGSHDWEDEAVDLFE